MHENIVLSVDQWNYLDKDSFLAISLFYSVLSEQWTIDQLPLIINGPCSNVLTRPILCE